MIELPQLAKETGVDHIWVKDESTRLGLPAFKILGASWAVYRELRRRVAAEDEPVAGFDALRERVDALRPFRLVASTEGNHGRSVARVARWLDVESTILIPASAERRRIEAIRSEGAEVVEVDGTYDDTVARLGQVCRPGDLMIQDTAWEGYETIPRWVVQGYSTMLVEIDEQLASLGSQGPTLVVVQCGVGSLASAVVLHFRRRPDTETVTLLSVEPRHAACVQDSVRIGRRSVVPTRREAYLAGLNCGQPSTLAWPVLSAGLDAAMSIDDEQARGGVRELDRAGIPAGPSGAAGLSGVLTLCRAGLGEEARARLGLGAGARILVFCTESAP
jgi:diaminopropionate ammonia-lyase